MKKWKASYTVEAAVIVPLFLAAMALAMRISIALYIEVRDQKEQEEIADMWEVENFYKFQIVDEVKND
ncbi:MAG: hypothetical protein PUF65_01830 [Lachnospiraceae bacterium]|nr:hypothetical protein [Lachnospiraceae bacterium]